MSLKVSQIYGYFNLKLFPNVKLTSQTNDLKFNGFLGMRYSNKFIKRNKGKCRKYSTTSVVTVTNTELHIL